MSKYEADLLWDTIAHGRLVNRLATIAGNIDLTLITRIVLSVHINKYIGKMESGIVFKRIFRRNLP